MNVYPQGGRFAAQMNAAARLQLDWDGDTKRWTTNNAEHVAAMRQLGARIEEEA